MYFFLKNIKTLTYKESFIQKEKNNNKCVSIVCLCVVNMIWFVAHRMGPV